MSVTGPWWPSCFYFPPEWENMWLRAEKCKNMFVCFIVMYFVSLNQIWKSRNIASVIIQPNDIMEVNGKLIRLPCITSTCVYTTSPQRRCNVIMKVTSPIPLPHIHGKSKLRRSILGKKSADDIWKCFVYFSQKKFFGIANNSCEMSKPVFFLFFVFFLTKIRLISLCCLLNLPSAC